MQPAFQTHNPAVSSQPSFEPPRPLHDPTPRATLTAQRPDSWLHAPQEPQPWFPIRTSRSHLGAAHGAARANHSDAHEHQLRRKTPHGIFDAGYDASPLSFPAGPPPSKHLALPAQPNHQSEFQHAGSYMYQHSMYPIDYGGAGRQDGNPYALRTIDNTQARLQGGNAWLPTEYVPQASIGLSSYRLASNVSEALPPIRAHEYNVRAFCPPPGPTSDFSHQGDATWQPRFLPWGFNTFERAVPSTVNYGLPPNPPQAIVGSHIGIEAVQRASASAHSNMGKEPVGQMPDTNNVQRHAHAIYATNQSGATGQPGFREKALIFAHRSYLNLLAHAQSSKKRLPTRGEGNNYRTTSRFSLYPKPPKPPAAFRNNQVSNVDAYSHNSAYRGSLGTENSYGLTHDVYPGLDLVTHRGLRPVDSQQSWQTPVEVPADTGFRIIGGQKPSDNAETASGILTALCDQSGLPWINGLLLLGCLHYGLERFEDARKAFSKVVDHDTSHIIALTNLASTLYCLNLHQEAQQTWLKALRLQPNHLEAAEHLVGLLYKKRCVEAIEVIDFVQQALRLRPSGSEYLGTGFPAIGNQPSQLSDVTRHDDMFNHTQASSPLLRGLEQRPGYGSSGYALPGSENGRILALVHAKGTMLYGLKDIQKAADAFEEAIIISVGRHSRDVQNLVQGIQAVLSPRPAPGGANPKASSLLQSLLLPPEKALRTAHLLFANDRGELPGLRYLHHSGSKRAAVQTTSNSLLSLAKIFQDSMSSYSSDVNILRQPPGIGDILALYYLSLSLQESPSTANNVGILLAGVQLLAPKSPNTLPGSDTDRRLPGIAPGSGLALALSYYHYGLRLDSKHVHLHTNLGSLLKDIGQIDLAIQMYEQAVSCDGTFDIALTNLANAVKDKGRIKDAISYYKRAVQANSQFAEAVCGLLTTLNSVCDWRGRGGVMLESYSFDRWHVDKDGRLVDARSHSKGSGLAHQVLNIVQQQLQEASYWGVNTFGQQAATSWANHLSNLCETDHADLLQKMQSWRGKPWEGARMLRLAERAVKVSMRLLYRQRCKSPVTESSRLLKRLSLPRELRIPPAPTVLPFHTFTTPLRACDIRVISQRNAMRISCSTLQSPWVPSTIYMPPPAPKPNLNVGYLSSDFNNHPLAHLMQSVFGLHDQRRVRAFCYATTVTDQSAHRQQIEREAPVFRDVSNWPAEKIAKQVTLDGIHILVNLNGYTRGARNEVFAARPAPIQMSFMGFAGSLGAEWSDYLLADRTAVPQSTLRPCRDNATIDAVFGDENESEGESWIYSENIIFCRGTFFCCDHKQSCDGKERGLSWDDEEARRWKMRKELFPELPDDVVILGNFNQLYKIEPTTFRTWLRILERAPKTILWLLRFPELGEENLRRTAVEWAGLEVAKRLVFMDVAPKSQHISRARVCDLFLDTPECNAHTTAADVLWSGTPLLTFPRYPYKMCSRMAASILTGALPESAAGQQAADDLIAKSEAEYEKSAIRLVGGLRYEVSAAGVCRGHGRLAELRKLLWRNRWTSSLFDTKKWVAELEKAYEEAWRRWVNGVSGDIYL